MGLISEAWWNLAVPEWIIAICGPVELCFQGPAQCHRAERLANLVKEVRRRSELIGKRVLGLGGAPDD